MNTKEDLLKKISENDSSLKILKVDDSNIRITELVTALENNTTINTLEIHNMEFITKNDFSILTNMLQKNKNINDLYLNNCHFENNSTNNILAQLINISSLSRIDLRRCNTNFVTDKVENVALTNAIKNNKTLDQLIINFINLSQGETALLHGLKENSSITSVSLAEVSLSQKSLNKITEYVERNTTYKNELDRAFEILKTTSNRLKESNLVDSINDINADLEKIQEILNELQKVNYPRTSELRNAFYTQIALVNLKAGNLDSAIDSMLHIQGPKSSALRFELASSIIGNNLFTSEEKKFHQNQLVLMLVKDIDYAEPIKVHIFNHMRGERGLKAYHNLSQQFDDKIIMTIEQLNNVEDISQMNGKQIILYEQLVLDPKNVPVLTVNVEKKTLNNFTIKLVGPNNLEVDLGKLEKTYQALESELFNEVSDNFRSKDDNILPNLLEKLGLSLSKKEMKEIRPFIESIIINLDTDQMLQFDKIDKSLKSALSDLIKHGANLQKNDPKNQELEQLKVFIVKVLSQRDLSRDSSRSHIRDAFIEFNRSVSHASKGLHNMKKTDSDFTIANLVSRFMKAVSQATQKNVERPNTSSLDK